MWFGVNARNAEIKKIITLHKKGEQRKNYTKYKIDNFFPVLKNNGT